MVLVQAVQMTDAAASSGLPAASAVNLRSSICAEVAAERVGLLHQAFAGDDLDHLVVVLLVLHVLLHLALHDDDRTDALVIFRTIVHVADQRRQLFALLIG